jgi:ketosteroid isomerase-like protein
MGRSSAWIAAVLPRDTARAMSEENVEIVRRHMQAYLSGDNEAALAAYHPEVEFDASLRPEGHVYRGREGVAEAMRVWSGTWEDWKVEVKEIIDAGDRVLLIAQESGRGKGSGVEIDQLVFAIFTLRNGKIVHWKGFVDRDQALEAAGLQG